MPDGNNPALLDRVVTGLRDFVGKPGHRQTANNAEWVRQQFDADPAMQQEYRRAAVIYPQLFQNDEATILSNVEAVLGHFGRDGLTRSEYFKALDAEPMLLQQKPATIISNVEAVMHHYAADQPTRTQYLQAAVEQPVLFRTPSAMVFASIEAAVDHREAEGITRSDFPSQAAKPSLVSNRQLEAINAHPQHPPSTVVHNPALYVSYVSPQGHTR